MYVVFADLEKAFDRVDWKKLVGILKKIGVDWKERREIGRTYGKVVLYPLHSSTSTWKI